MTVEERDQKLWHAILQALRRVRYGRIVLYIEDGRVDRFDVTETRKARDL